MEKTWSGFHQHQVDSFEIIFDSLDDLIVSAPTAAGKTECASLPLATLAAQRNRAGTSVLWLSPLRALIDQTAERIRCGADRVGVAVTSWHGDAREAPKRIFRRSPEGFLVTTPESLEGRFLRGTAEIAKLFGDLDFIVFDELHTFLTGARALQLSAQMARLDEITLRRARRVGLSATLGDELFAQNWLRPDNPGAVRVVKVASTGRKLRTQIRGYRESTSRRSGPATLLNRPALDLIADDIRHEALQGKVLAFTNSRRDAEAIANYQPLRPRPYARETQVLVHHSSVSASRKASAIADLRRGRSAVALAATSSLELGLDIGSIDTVFQVGAPQSVAALRQRAGRCGRRERPGHLIVAVREKMLHNRSRIMSRLRLKLARSIAALELMHEGFCEPPTQGEELGSALVHQTLSVVAQRGSVCSSEMLALLRRAYLFRQVSDEEYDLLLESLASADVELITRHRDGKIRLGNRGEKIVYAHEFCALFPTRFEWEVRHGHDVVGSIQPPFMDNFCLSGRRWRLISVDRRRKSVRVKPDEAAALPAFDLTASTPIHARLCERTYAVLAMEAMPAGLDPVAFSLMEEGRSAFREFGLHQSPFTESDGRFYIFTWAGTILNSLLAAHLALQGISAQPQDVAVSVAPSDRAKLLARLQDEVPRIQKMASTVPLRKSGKYDHFVPEALLRRFWARQYQPFEEELGELTHRLRYASL